MASGTGGTGEFRRRLLPVITVRIVGSSMEPALKEGDWVLARYWPAGISARSAARAVGKVILVRRATQPELLTVKRLIKILDTGYWVEGDNAAASTDSRHYLTINRQEIVGRLLFRYRRGR